MSQTQGQEVFYSSFPTGLREQSGGASTLFLSVPTGTSILLSQYVLTKWSLGGYTIVNKILFWSH